MGLLDDAIREHLELKRRRGADAGEISREESEALGPVRRSPDGTPDIASIPGPAPEVGPPPPAGHDVDAEPDWGDETVAHTPPPIPAQPASGYVMPPPPGPLEPAFDDSQPLPPLEDPEPEPPREKRRMPGAGRLRLRRGRSVPPPEDAAPTPESEYEPPTVAYTPPPPAAYEPAPPDEVGAPPESKDVLEETPDFLEETPDHDRLWFEQRPPRDFDFDK